MKMLLVTVLTSVTNQELGVAWIRPESTPETVSCHLHHWSHSTTSSAWTKDQMLQRYLTFYWSSNKNWCWCWARYLWSSCSQLKWWHMCWPRVSMLMVVRESGVSVTYFQVDNWGDICGSLTMWCRLLTSRLQQFIASSEPGHRDFHY